MVNWISSDARWKLEGKILGKSTKDSFHLYGEFRLDVLIIARRFFVSFRLFSPFENPDPKDPVL